MKQQPKVVLVARALVEEKGKILMARRAWDESWGQGRWELPGGKVESHENIYRNLRREVKEELGLRITVGDIVYVHANLSEKDGRRRIRYIAHYFSAKPAKRARVPKVNGKEHEEFRWVTPRSALRLAPLTQGTKEAIKKLIIIKKMRKRSG